MEKKNRIVEFITGTDSGVMGFAAVVFLAGVWATNISRDVQDLKRVHPPMEIHQETHKE